MPYKRVKVGPLDNNCYIIHDKGKAVMIDASGGMAGARKITETVKGADLKVSRVYITHGHFDHIDAAHQLKENTNATVIMNEQDDFLWREIYDESFYEPLKAGSSIQVGDLEVQLLPTPGHTPGSTCYYLPNSEAVFTGDTLFPGGPGATRWEYSNLSTILDSIRTKLFTLPDRTKVLPGHGPATTIGEEKTKFQKLQAS